MKRIILSVLTLVLVSLSVFADSEQEALKFFNSYVEGANNYSPTIADMYSPNAKIIRQVIKPDGTTADAVTDTATYIKQMKLGQAGAKLRQYKNLYTNITVTPLENGAFKISSLTSLKFIIKDWLLFREEDLSSLKCDEDRKHWIYFDEISESILRNVPKENKKYVEKQLNKLDNNFLDYIAYWNEKYYRNGFVDGSQLVMGCFDD